MITKDVFAEDMVNKINENLRFIKQANAEYATHCLGSARSALEAAVKLFWWEKYNIKIETLDDETNKLFAAMSDSRFTDFFDEEILTKMNLIRKQANKVLHNENDLSPEEASALINLLGECIVAVENAIPMQILSVNEKKKPTSEPAKTTFSKKENNYGANTVNYTDVNERQKSFYETFQSALNQNGNPFVFKARAGYGTINKRSANSDLCLGFDFWVPRKGFRINIYVRNDSQTRYFDRLYRQKEQIERELGFKPEWVDHGAHNPNTRRIQTCLYFNEHNVEEYEALLDEALPKIMKYLQVFSKYLPEAFEDDCISVTLNNIPSQPTAKETKTLTTEADKGTMAIKDRFKTKYRKLESLCAYTFCVQQGVEEYINRMQAIIDDETKKVGVGLKAFNLHLRDCKKAFFALEHMPFAAVRIDEIDVEFLDKLCKDIINECDPLSNFLHEGGEGQPINDRFKTKYRKIESLCAYKFRVQQGVEEYMNLMQAIIDDETKKVGVGLKAFYLHLRDCKKAFFCFGAHALCGCTY